MAKIAHFDHYSDRLKKRVEGDIYYHLERNRNTGSTGFFFVPIPEEFKELWETFKEKGARQFYNRGSMKTIIEGVSADEAEKRYMKYLEMYADAKSKVDKVIMYRFKYSSKDKSSDPPKGGGMSSFSDGVAHTMEAKIEFDFAVCDKTNFNGKITYKAHDKETGKRVRYIENRDSSFDKPGKKTGKSYGGWVELEYTPEAEAFFTQVYSGMEGIMDKLMKFIGTEEGVLTMIANQQKLIA